MEIFQKLGNVANKTCKYTSQQTNRLATIAKLKWEMNDYKSKVNNLYQELGKVVYENNVREDMEDFEEQIKEKCEEIDELASNIETRRKKILKLNNKKQCQNCYTEIYDVFKFCPNCGEAQSSKEKIKQDKKEDINEQIDLDLSYVETEKTKNNYEEDN